MGVGYKRTLVVSNASTAGVAALQAPTSGTPLTLTASPVTLPNTGQRPSLTSSANLSAINFTLVGKDQNGLAMTLVIVGPNNNTVVAPMSMSTITSVTPGGTSASTVSVGWDAAADMPLCPCDVRYNPTDISFAVHVSAGSPTYTATYTLENPNAVAYSGNPSWVPGSAVWFNHPVVSSLTSDTTGNYDKPVAAASLYVSGGGSTVTYQQWQGVGPN